MKVLAVDLPGKIGGMRPRLAWLKQEETDRVEVKLWRKDAKDRGRWWKRVHGLSHVRKTLPLELGEIGVKSLVRACVITRNLLGPFNDVP